MQRTFRHNHHFTDEIWMGQAIFHAFAQLTAHRRLNANGTYTEVQRPWVLYHSVSLAPRGGSVRCIAAPQIEPAHCSFTSSSDHDWQRCNASAHTRLRTNPSTPPQPCSQSTTAAEAAAPQQHSPPYSNQNEHLNIICKWKAN